MSSYHNLAMLVLTTGICVSVTRAQPSTVSVTISAKAQSYRTLGDVVLEIRISNLGDHRISLRTIDADPPVLPAAVDDAGRPAILTTMLPKTGTTRNLDYVLDARQIRRYEVTVRQLLGKGQQLSGGNAGPFNVKVVLLSLQYRDGIYKADQIESNSMRVGIAPQ